MKESRQIKKFILFVIKISLILTCAYFAYQGLFWYLWLYENGPRAYENSYQHALYRQYQQISDKNRDNEIIFFGSSTCTFGIDVNTVKEVTGENAQIFAIESAITPVYLMRELRKIAKPGDTICCIFDADEANNESFLTTCCAFEDDKDYLKNYFNSHTWDFSIHKPTLIWRKIYALSLGGIVDNLKNSISVKDQIYTLSSFDENGNMKDIKEECFVSSDVGQATLLSFETLDPELTSALNEFNDWCEANDVRFVIAYNMHVEGSLFNDEASLEEYHEAFCNAVNAEVITRPEDGVLPYDCFYNSCYHLNNKGAKEYSARIAEKLIN